MSEWNAGYYGSGLRLNEEEFMSFFNITPENSPASAGGGMNRPDWKIG